MLRKLNLLIPNLLKELDHRLLLHHPLLWSTRICYLLFVLAVGAGIASFSTWWIVVSNVPKVETRIALMFIPVVLTIGYWGWWLYHHRIEARFGEGNFASRVGNQLIVLGGVVLLAIMPFLYGIQLIRQIDNSVSTELLARDLEALSEGLPYFMETTDQDMAERDLHDFTGHPKMSGFNGDYYIPGITFSDLTESNLSQNPEVQYTVIDRFKEVFSTYSGIDLDYPTQNVFRMVKEGHTFHYPEVYLNWDKAIINLRRIAKAKNRDHFIYQFYIINFLLSFILLGGLMFLVFQQAGIRPFVVGIAMVFGLILSSILLNIVLAYFVRITWLQDDFGIESLLSLFFWAGFAVFNLKSFTATAGKFGKLLQQGCLVAASLTMVFIPFLTLFGFRIEMPSGFERHHEFLYFFGLPTVVAIFLWLFVFSPRLKKLKAAPRRG